VVRFLEVQNRIGRFEVLNVETSGDLPVVGSDQDVRLWTRSQTLSTLALGKQTIPPVQVEIGSPNVNLEAGEPVGADEDSAGNAPKRLASKPIEVEVTSVLDEAAQRDPAVFNEIVPAIKPDLESPSTTTGLLDTWIALAAAIVVGLAAVGMILFRRTESPERWFRRRLQALQDALSNQQALSLESADELRLVVANLISAEIPVRVGAQSTDQMVKTLRQIAEDHSHPRKEDFAIHLEQIFEQADRLKFAGQTPSRIDAARFRSALDEAWQLFRWVCR